MRRLMLEGLSAAFQLGDQILSDAAAGKKPATASSRVRSRASSRATRKRAAVRGYDARHAPPDKTMTAHLDSNHRDTVEQIFNRPSSGNVEWRRVRSLL